MTLVTSQSFDPLDPDVGVGGWAEDALDWILDNVSFFFDAVKSGLQTLNDTLVDILHAPHFLIMIGIFVAIAWSVRSWKFALFTALAFYLIAAMGQWENAMDTLALVVIAAFIAVILSVPIGILAAKNRVTSSLVRPVLDFMQTLPPMVYLVPAIMAFRIGEVPGMVATIVFAMPPGVRFTELAIRQVDPEVVEAGYAFGAAPRRILRQIQFPLALPTIMAGINQVIMLSLSMVVIAGMVGAGGLGSEVYGSITRIDVATGVEAGLGVVFLAIYLDRVVASLTDRAPVIRASRVRD